MCSLEDLDASAVVTLRAPDIARKSVTLFVGAPLCHYDIANRRAPGLSTLGLFIISLSSPLWGVCSREDLDANAVVTLRAQPGGVISVAPGRVTPHPTLTPYTWSRLRVLWSFFLGILKDTR